MRRKERKITGIYKITSPSGKIYIGLSNNILARWRTHKSISKKKCNFKLINSFKKYGVENHIFEVIHECKEEELNEWEIYYGNLFDVMNPEIGLNTRECGGAKGKMSQDTKDKLSKIAKIRFSNPENNPFFGKHHTEETKEILREINVGKKRSRESVEKMIVTNTGRKRDDEFKKNRTGDKNGMFGRKHSEETKKAHSERMKGRNTGKKSPETIAKRVATFKANNAKRREDKLKNDEK